MNEPKTSYLFSMPVKWFRSNINGIWGMLQYKQKMTKQTDTLVITTKHGQWIIKMDGVYSKNKSYDNCKNVQVSGYGLLHRHLKSCTFHIQKQIYEYNITTNVESLLRYILNHDFIPHKLRGMSGSIALNGDELVHMHHMTGKLENIIVAAMKLDVLNEK